MFNIPDNFSVQDLVILNPKKVLEHLHHIITVISDDKVKWGRAFATGFVSSADLNTLAMVRDKDQFKVIVEFLECSGLILHHPKPSNIAGMEYFIPYFAQVPSSTDVPATGKNDMDLYLQFDGGHESTPMFYQLAFGLAGLCDAPDSVTVQAINCCAFFHTGRHITMFHQKLEDRIKFIFKM